MPRRTNVTTGSDNVFADIGVPDAPEYLAKADLACKIVNMIRERGLSQSEAADQLGIDQPKVSALMRGLLTGFSTDRLLRFIRQLGAECEIVIHNRTALAADAMSGSTTGYIVLGSAGSHIMRTNAFAVTANEDWRLATPLLVAITQARPYKTRAVTE